MQTMTLGGGGDMKTLSTQKDMRLNHYSGSMLEEGENTDEDLDEKGPGQRTTPGSNMMAKSRSRTAAG